MIITGFVMRRAIARARLHKCLKFLGRDFKGNHTRTPPYMPKIP